MSCIRVLLSRTVSRIYNWVIYWLDIIIINRTVGSVHWHIPLVKRKWIDRSMNMAISLNNSRYNHKHLHVPYCYQKTVWWNSYCNLFIKQIIGILASNGSMHFGQILQFITNAKIVELDSYQTVNHGHL